MSTVEIDSVAFATGVREGNYRGAVASIMGQNPTGIKRTKRFLIEFQKLESTHQEAVLHWSRLPSERLPISDQRWYVEEIARHEMAHIVVAKALGFSTGEATLVLYSPDGSHQGTSVIHLGFSTPSLDEISKYLERRIIVLLAGYLAEPDNAHKRKSHAHQIIKRKSTESDLQKAMELMQIKLNIEGSLHSNSIDGVLYSLVRRASEVVEANFSVISSLAQKFSARFEFYEQTIGWEGCEIDNQPEIQQIVNMQ